MVSLTSKVDSVEAFPYLPLHIQGKQVLSCRGHHDNSFSKHLLHARYHLGTFTQVIHTGA